MSTQQSKPGWLTRIRAVVLFLFGLGLMGHQAFVVPHDRFNWIVMLFGGALSGVPGVAELMPGLLGRGGGSAPSATAPLPSPPPEPAPLPPSSS